jgi:hypothetical protein
MLFSLLGGWLTIMASVAFSQAQAATLNVTNFGARGDAVQFFGNTRSNSVVVTTTNQLSIADIGKAIEVFGVGAVVLDTNGMVIGNQDLIAAITNVINGTNIYISRVAQATLTNTFATYGHNNRTNFQNTIAAASGTNTIINIPAGSYLFLSTNRSSDPSAWYSVNLTNGGIHLVGEGMTNTILLGQGAWFSVNYLGTIYCKRGIIFAITPPIANDYPVSIENMTLDGGVQQGNTSRHGWPASPVDGQGWDGSHGAIDIRGFTGKVFTHMLWTNLLIIHWRGEMVKSNDGSTNGNITMVNCTFRDGNATAINIYPSLFITNCVFDNLFQVAEYYQRYSTNTSCFVNNLATNISGNGFAINGGRGNNPDFVIQGNTFIFNTNSLGYSAILTTPGDNVYVISNQITFLSGNGTCVAAGVPGYQGTFDNSNIVVRGNTFINPSIVLQVNGGGMFYADSNKTEAVEVYGNTLIKSNSPSAANALAAYTYCTNVYFHDNDFLSQVSLKNVRFASGNRGNQFARVSTNNLYWSQIYDLTGKTNYISYANGSRFQIIYGFHAGTVYALCDTNASQIPPGAQMLIVNSNSSSASIPVYLNSALTGSPVTIASAQTQTFYWTNGVWANIASATNAPAVIQVTPGSISCGTVLSGTSKTNSITVQNVGSGPLSGTASVGAPFSIVSGGSYNLGSNQSQTVTVVFSPSVASNYTQSVSLSGGGGTNAVVSGSATNAPVLNPVIQVTPGSISYGMVLSGTSKTSSFTVQNVGNGTLSGMASVGAPFSILSGGSYSLSANGSQTVMVAFSPSAAGSYNQSVTFTGGGGTNTSVSGSATNVPPVLPTVSAISANVPDVDTNTAVLQIYAGTAVQLSASASAPNGDALTWQWLYNLNGGTQTVYQSGSGTAPTTSFTYTNGTAGNTYAWNLQVTDSQTKLSAQSQLTLSVKLVPPQKFRVTSN